MASFTREQLETNVIGDMNKDCSFSTLPEEGRQELYDSGSEKAAAIGKK